MDKQKIFTNASYEYTNEIYDLSIMADYYKLDKKKLIYGFDILLQLSLMHMVSLDGEISVLELDFLKNIVYDNDLMVILTQRIGRRIDWNFIKGIKEYDIFLNSVTNIMLPEITSFITILTSADFQTTEDYLNRLKGAIYYICQALLEIDGFDPLEKEAYKVLDETLFKRMDEIKELSISKSNINAK